ncbi:Uncharacterized protein FWK35_00018190, partial [Aphis craccivora]
MKYNVEWSNYFLIIIVIYCLYSLYNFTRFLSMLFGVGLSHRYYSLLNLIFWLFEIPTVILIKTTRNRMACSDLAKTYYFQCIFDHKQN